MNAPVNSHITPDEWASLALDAKLHQRSAWLYQRVSQTQLSIARHYGGIAVNDESYVYCPPTDELIRGDVLKALGKLRKSRDALDDATKNAAPAGAPQEQRWKT